MARHVRKLSRALARFAAGERHLHNTVVHGAPAELMTLGQAFSDMSESITRGEAALEDIIRQRALVLREVHHRVRNTLQLMASIMTLQRRKAGSLEAKRMIKGLQDRIMSLTTIQADALFADVVHKSARLALGADTAVVIETEFAPMTMDRDQAVPLALFLSEAIGTAAQPLPAKGKGASWLRIALQTLGDDRAVLRVSHPLADSSAPAIDPAFNAPMDAPFNPGPDDGLGMRLMTTFARQIGGTLISDKGDGTCRHTLGFMVQRRLDEPEDIAAQPGTQPGA